MSNYTMLSGDSITFIKLNSKIIKKKPLMFATPF